MSRICHHQTQSVLSTALGRRVAFRSLRLVPPGQKLPRGPLSYTSVSHIHWCPTDRAVKKSPRPGGMSGPVFSPLEATGGVSRWQQETSRPGHGEASETRPTLSLRCSAFAAEHRVHVPKLDLGLSHWQGNARGTSCERGNTGKGGEQFISSVVQGTCGCFY